MAEDRIQTFHANNRNTGERKLLLSTQQVAGYDIEECGSVLGSDFEPSYTPVPRATKIRAPQKAASWVQKTYLRRVQQQQPSAEVSKGATFQLVAEHEQRENDGSKTIITYTATPAKAREFHGTPQFSTITPQQALALYVKNHSSANRMKEHNREDKYRPSTVWRAGNRNMAYSSKAPAEVDDISHSSVTVGASKSFESVCSSTDGIEFSHGEDKPLPKLC